MSRPVFALLLMLSAAAALAGPRQVFIAGDSTASEYGPERAPREGWGMQLQSFLAADRYQVRNLARSGRSARSFIEEGWIDGITSEIGAGDVLLIQFGHNDEKIEDPSRYNDPAVAFPRWLSRYVELARQHNATPILVTPLARRKFDHGQLLDTHGLYTQAVRQLAQAEQVALIDLNASSSDWLRALGDEASRDYFMHVPAQALQDDTHLQQRGAVAVACLVVRGWLALDPGLQASLVRDSDCGAPATAASDLRQQPHPSALVHERDIPVQQVGPHGGAGSTTAYPFFADAPALGFQFRKRVLHKGAGIGLHPHHKDEIYYVLAGRGKYIIDGQVHPVAAGDAMLTRPGSSHAIQQDGDEDLALLIMYQNTPKP
ncbi:cupin domain-containing protein [Pseudoxanthomonas dokdonensis]|uniref:Rhamnogalacturonan acetylesterase n=1 Tax=Pseudoxanthomonas dokdonensis TaxID=344882 RepID=A0A0R0CRC8_9GAMM|nr:cupin domain-containing protein [Pseudoxanthomonas dokdonensis]KRG68583.1 rhamnogalacturonan acetylesterase [Pseudoxanthomonas dokdonensis]